MKFISRTLYLSLILCAVSPLAALAQKDAARIEKRIDSLLKLMTPEEKAGQLNQYTGDRLATGPVQPNSNKYNDIRQGRVGSMLNVRGASDTRAVQQLAMQSRLKIPLLFGQDVIHGYRVTFPVPLAEAASWDMAAIQKAARIAAIEAAGSGLHWTFAPMVDIARDPRWGRVTEGAGEDPFLGSRIAEARVHGFQGKGLGDTSAIMACVKHFAAYGAGLAGRDYNPADMSERELWETYLPPFKAAAAAGAASFMNAFNLLNGVPATASSYLQRDILKKQWGFKGLVVSDWNSVGEMVSHGFAEDRKRAALYAMLAGSDMDMESHSYIDFLPQLIKEKKIPIAIVDDAVRRVLRKKFELGLFDDPYRFSNEERERKLLGAPAHHEAALDMARKSIVLLKNEKGLLPLNASVKNIALIGPLAASGVDMKGAWSVSWESDSLVSVYDGLRKKLGANATIRYEKGCDISSTDTSRFAAAAAVANGADVIIIVVGESFTMSGEAKSRSSLELPGVQEELIKRMVATGRPVIVLVMAGRPLIFNWTADHADAVVYTWFLGSEGGNAIADVLTGEYNPSGKLPISFPRAVGQIPLFYNHTNTGRPVTNESNITYKSAYIDVANTPKYAFGYGLSYTRFDYADLKLSTSNLRDGEQLRVSCTVTNSGDRDGEEVVQLYLHDLVASIARPVMELKGFQKIFLRKGESRKVEFLVGKNELSFYNNKLEWISEKGRFELMIGSASNDIRLRQNFELVK